MFIGVMLLLNCQHHPLWKCQHHPFLFLFPVAKKPSGVLSFFRGTGGKSPDLSSQKKETLRGADSAYYQVGQMGKEGAENQGAETQGTRLQSPPSLLHCYFSQTSFICARPRMHSCSYFFNSAAVKPVRNQNPRIQD